MLPTGSTDAAHAASRRPANETSLRSPSRCRHRMRVRMSGSSQPGSPCMAAPRPGPLPAGRQYSGAVAVSVAWNDVPALSLDSPEGRSVSCGDSVPLVRNRKSARCPSHAAEGQTCIRSLSGAIPSPPQRREEAARSSPRNWAIRKTTVTQARRLQLLIHFRRGSSSDLGRSSPVPHSRFGRGSGVGEDPWRNR